VQTCQETEEVRVRPDAPVVRLVFLWRQYRFEPVTRRHRYHGQFAAVEGSQFLRQLFVRAVNEVGVDRRRQRIRLHARTCVNEHGESTPGRTRACTSKNPLFALSELNADQYRMGRKTILRRRCFSEQNSACPRDSVRVISHDYQKLFPFLGMLSTRSFTSYLFWPF